MICFIIWRRSPQAIISFYDSNGDNFLEYYLSTAINKWLNEQNTDYLYLYLDHYLDHHWNDEFRQFFVNDDFLNDILIDHMENILCLINDHWPDFLRLDKPMNHQDLISAYRVSSALDMPLSLYIKELSEKNCIDFKDIELS